MSALTLERARDITQALATPVAPAARAPQHPYTPQRFIDPNAEPAVRVLEGLEARLAWVSAGGDIKLLQGRTS
jgi:hypothetical protein